VYLTNEYNSAGRVTKQTQADNSTYQFAYTLNTNGKITQTDVTDPRGNVRRLTFNSNGYTLSVTRALGKPEQQIFSYERQSGTNLILSVTDPLSRTTSFTFDAMGNLASVTRLSGTSGAVTTTITHEPGFNQVASVTDPLNHTTTFGYDPTGNLTSISDPLNHQTTFAYNTSGQPVSVTDPLQHIFQFTYDGGDLIAITDPLGRTGTRSVDALGRPITATNPLGQRTRYEYNPLNQLIRKIDPIGGVTAFGYDPNGNLLNLTDARNSLTSYVHDNMDRATTRRDPLLHDEIYQYDLNGNLTQVTDRKGQLTTYSYDALNRLTQVTHSDASTISYTRDGGNRLTQVVDSLSGTIALAYDSLNRLISTTTPQGTISYTYDAVGRRTTMTISGQPTVNYSYNNSNKLTEIAQGSSVVTIAYDAKGRKTSLTLPNGVVTDYGYDAASELTSLEYKRLGNVIGNLAYEYDAAGRRTKIGGSFARTGLPQPMPTATYNGANQLTQRGSATLTYDFNGNLIGDGSNVYGWNTRNKLVSITGSVNASFQYDAFGRRISKTSNGTSFGYLHDGANVVQQLSGTTPVANLLTGGIDEVFTRTDAAGTRCLLSAHLRSVLSLTDDNGALLTQYTYEPFGQTIVTGTSSTNSVQYTGRENDDTGLYFYRARYYSPTLQRFISEDPIGFRSGEMNLYSYVNNNPMNSFDSFGLDDQEPDHGGPVNPPEVTAKEITLSEMAKGVAEAGGKLSETLPARALPIVGGLGDVAPGIYNIVERKRRELEDIQDLCCQQKMGCCERDNSGPNPGDGTSPNPNDSTTPNPKDGTTPNPKDGTTPNPGDVTTSSPMSPGRGKRSN